jgi:Zn-finger nucleic acid-binding protein
LIDNINQERFSGNQSFKYLKCPVCEEMMNRSAFGHKSGVIVDRCNNHGIWLDGGEISHLLEWKQAGGQLRDEQKRLEGQAPYQRGEAKGDIEKLLAQNQKNVRDWSSIGDIAEVILNLLN